jgi:hypothetical protein
MRPLIVGGLLWAVVTCWAATSYAQGASATVLYFSCEGKLTGTLISEEKPEQLHNVGLVVNLAERTVSFGGFVAPFNKVDAANIYFHGESQQQGISVTVDGNIDRVTGAVEASTISTAGSKSLTTFYWNILCKPTTRLF